MIIGYLDPWGNVHGAFGEALSSWERRILCGDTKWQATTSKPPERQMRSIRVV